MTIIGTSHFVNFTKACDYYRAQGNEDLTPLELMRLVHTKMEEGEIELGMPSIKGNEKLLIIDDGTRYAIEA